MSQPSAVQGDLEDRSNHALDVMFNIFSNNDTITGFIYDAIDDGMSEAGLSNEYPVSREEFFDQAVQVMLEANGWDNHELKRDNQFLKDNIADLQRQLQEAYKRLQWHKDVYK